MNNEELRQSLRFYQDLGVTDLYRMPAPVAAKPEMQVTPPLAIPSLEPSDDTLEKIQQDIGPDCRRGPVPPDFLCITFANHGRLGARKGGRVASHFDI